MQVFRVKKIHCRRRSTTDGGTRGGLARQRIAAKPLEATIQHDVSIQVLQALKAKLGQIRCGVLRADTLDSLESIEVVAVRHVISDDQVRVVTAPDQLDPEGVHLAENGGGT